MSMGKSGTGETGAPPGVDEPEDEDDGTSVCDTIGGSGSGAAGAFGSGAGTALGGSKAGASGGSASSGACMAQGRPRMLWIASRLMRSAFGLLLIVLITRIPLGVPNRPQQRSRNKLNFGVILNDLRLQT